MADRAEIDRKLQEYSNFVESVLKPKLSSCGDSEKGTRLELQEYDELRMQLLDRQSNPTMDFPLVDLGHNTVYCKATADDLSRLFVHVGMGFHVELTVSEALEYLAKRTSLLERVLKEKISEKSRVEEHIRAAESIVDQLSRERSRIG